MLLINAQYGDGVHEQTSVVGRKASLIEEAASRKFGEETFCRNEDKSTV